MRTLLVALLLSLSLLSQGVAQTALPETLSPDQAVKLQAVIQSADLESFVVAARNYWKTERQGMDEQTRDQIRNILANESRARLLNTESLTSISTGVLQELVGWAGAVMNPGEKQDLLELLENAIQNDNLGTPFEDFQHSVAFESILGENSYASRTRIAESVRAWISANDIDALETSQLNWCFRMLAPHIETENGFRVIWTGLITVPRDGEYTFSVGAWSQRIQQIEDGLFVENSQGSVLKINGETVIETSSEDGKRISKPIRLSGGENVAFRFEFTSSWTNDHHRLCPVVLFWEGPGVQRSVVPESAFTAEEGGPVGLRAEYSWKETADSKPETVTVIHIDPNIDFYWNSCLTVGVRDETLTKLGDEYFDRWTDVKGDFVGDVVRLPQKLALLTTGQLTECLEALTERPSQLSEVSVARMERFYTAVRCADKPALDVLGTWMTQHEYVPPEPAANVSDYFDLNRQFYYRLSEYLAFENPDRMAWLEEKYLKTPKESCCLHAANTLAECHLVLGSIAKWIEQLDGYLDDETLNVSQRIDWLVARSLAEELRHAAGNRYYRTREILLAGNDWLVEAELIAEDSLQYLNILKERIARLVATGRWEAVENQLSTAEGRYGDLQPEIAALRNKADEVRVRAQQTDQLAEDAAHAAYIDELNRRRIRASNLGDQRAVQRYDKLLSESPQATE